MSPACRQVKGRFLLQGALVYDCRVCWGEQTGSSQRGTIPSPPQHKGNPNFHPIPMTDMCGIHLNLPSVLLALDSVAFTGLFWLPSRINSAQMPPPLGSLPWLSLLPLRMTLSFPYPPTSHSQKLCLIQLFLPWRMVVGCLGRMLLPGRANSCLQVLSIHIWLGGKPRLGEEAWFAQVPTAVGDGLGEAEAQLWYFPHQISPWNILEQAGSGSPKKSALPHSFSRN